MRGLRRDQVAKRFREAFRVEKGKGEDEGVTDRMVTQSLTKAAKATRRAAGVAEEAGAVEDVVEGEAPDGGTL